MAVAYVRKSFSSNDLKSEVNKVISPKVKKIATNKNIRNDIAREYSKAVKRYVPRSTRNESHHHLQTAKISDGRVTWFRSDSKGNEIAGTLYKHPIIGVYRKRANGGDDVYGLHEPSTMWDRNVRPGTADWSLFVKRVTPIIAADIKKSMESK